MTNFEILTSEIARFIRCNYKLDEIAGKYYETDCLRFRQGKKTVFSILLHKDYYEFQIIFGQAEREVSKFLFADTVKKNSSWSATPVRALLRKTRSVFLSVFTEVTLPEAASLADTDWGFPLPNPLLSPIRDKLP